MAIFQLPDGRRFDVPDSIPREEAIRHLREKFPLSPVQPQAEILPQRTLQEEGMRQLGLTGRALVEGTAEIPVIAANALANVLNTAFGTQFPEQGQAISNLLTQAGLPQPQTPTEELVQDVGKAISGTGAFVRGAQAAAPTVSRILSPFQEALGAAASATGASGAQQLGFDPIAQIIAGLLAGTTAGALPRAPREVSDIAIFDDVSQRGIDDVQAFSELRRELGDEASRLQEQISGRFEDGIKVEPGLFDIAKERGQNAFVNKESVRQLSNDFKRQAFEEIDDDATKIFQNAADRLDTFIGQDNVTVNDLEGLRRAASQASRRNFAGGAVARDVDQFLENSLKDNVTGDTEAINVWKEAISKRREFGRKFQNPKEIAAAIGDEAIETVEKRFLGSGPLSSKTELATIYDNTLKALPKEDQEAAGFLLRQSLVNRMIKRAARTSDDDEGLSASFMANQIRNLRRENKSIWNKFPNEEKKILNRLEQNLRKKSRGGPVNKVAQALFNFLGRATRSNLELPRTLKPKTVVDVEELINLTRIKPQGARGVFGTTVGVQEPIEEISQ